MSKLECREDQNEVEAETVESSGRRMIVLDIRGEVPKPVAHFGPGQWQVVLIGERT